MLLAPEAATPAAALDDSVARARAALLRRQRADGHWVFELEADATIPAEYVLLEHFLDRIDPELQRRIGNYLRGIQGAHGGWPLFHDGAFNLSATVKAYFALKAIGDDVAAPHMARARAAVLAAGGAERSNVFTRCAAGAVRRGAMARGAGDAARTGAAAALVAVPPGPRLVLVPHRAGAAAGADGPPPAGEEPARGAHRRVVRDAAGAGARLDSGAVPLGLGTGLQIPRRGGSRGAAGVAEGIGRARRAMGGGVRHRTAERRARARSASTPRWRTA